VPRQRLAFGPSLTYHSHMIDIIRKSKRGQLKQESLNRILEAGSKRVRLEGLNGSAIVPIMRDAGLTHGAFYAHFADKGALTIACFVHAIETGRTRWIGNDKDETWCDRLKRLAKRYLTKAHRDDLATGCAFAALESDAARSSAEFRDAYEQQLRKSLAAICEPFEASSNNAEHLDDAIALMALCIGGLSLARAVNNEDFSDRILRACRNAAGVMTEAK